MRYMENRGNRYGGYAQGNSGYGKYRGGKRGNAGSRGGGGKSSFASPEMIKAVYLVAAIPAVAVLMVFGYFFAEVCL